MRTLLQPRGKPTAQALFTRRGKDSILVGAAIGTGLAANFAVRGGADFLLALSAGRVRSMGEPSLAAMLPAYESNSFVMDFASREILPKASVPVFFGASAFDPRSSLDVLVRKVAKAGFHGVTNFPTVALMDGPLRELLEAEGLGFRRELQMLAKARAAGLATIAYTHTPAEAEASAERGVDIVNIDLGWNQGGVTGATTELSLEEAALQVDYIARLVRKLAPGTLCTVEGGPIVSPAHLAELSRIAQIDGYIGGSTIDRVPLESAIEAMTANFKTVDFNERSGRRKRRAPAETPPLALIGRSVRRLRSAVDRLSHTDIPVLIVAPTGAGGREIAEAMHRNGPRGARTAVSVALSEINPSLRQIELYGCAAGQRQESAKARLGLLEISQKSTLILQDVELLPERRMRELARVVERGRASRVGERAEFDVDVRLIAIANTADLSNARRTVLELEKTGFAIINVPPLSERPEDMPALLETIVERVRRKLRKKTLMIEPSTYRMLLQRSWPGDVASLYAAIQSAALLSDGDEITPVELRGLEAAVAGTPTRTFATEREWILDGLRRNRFRRGATAEFLGIARKTLYNKMQKYRISKPL